MDIHSERMAAENLKMIRSTESGNNDIANMMVRKIWNYLKMNRKQCNLIIEGSRLTVEIQGIDSGNYNEGNFAC